ncbi:MAG: hypothetical protein LBU85_09255 [Treponema sp.]|jgi:hypothetical protein|nr:hypothetical protein [Treponema sp.]
MSVKSLVDMRNEAVNQIKEAINKKEIFISEHPGQFDASEIKRLATQTPAILTSLMRYSDENNTARFATWVLYRATAKDRLYDGALKIVTALIPIIRELDAEWSIGGGADIDAECLYSGALDQINITLWGVRWNWQTTGIVPDEGGGALIDDLDYFRGYDAGHQIKDCAVEDIVNLEVSNANTD